MSVYFPIRYDANASRYIDCNWGIKPLRSRKAKHTNSNEELINWQKAVYSWCGAQKKKLCHDGDPGSLQDRNAGNSVIKNSRFMK